MAASEIAPTKSFPRSRPLTLSHILQATSTHKNGKTVRAAVCAIRHGVKNAKCPPTKEVFDFYVCTDEGGAPRGRLVCRRNGP